MVDGLGRAGHDTRTVVIGRDGVWCTDDASWRFGPVRGCSARTSSSRCFTGRSARTAPCRGCWSCWTSRTWAPGCCGSAVAMDKVDLQGPAGARRGAAGGLRGGAERGAGPRAGSTRSRAGAAAVREAGAPGLVRGDLEGVGAGGAGPCDRGRVRARSGRDGRGRPVGIEVECSVIGNASRSCRSPAR